MATTNVKKRSTAGGGGKFSYKYTDLATIHEALEEQAITYYQYTEFDEKAQADYIWTVLRYGDDKEGKPLRGTKIVEGKTLSGGNSAQEYGSALTYARRYSLLLALGWATEDDDAASVGQSHAQPAAHPSHNNYDGRLDFDKVKEWLLQLNSVEEVEAAKVKLLEKYPNITEKQQHAINRIFASRCDQLTPNEDRDKWHDAEH